MSIATVRRLAADILRVGEGRVRIDPTNLSEVQGALTREDVRSLIEKGMVSKKPVQGRASARKGKTRGKGRRRGSRTSEKEEWMMRVRAQRRFLRMLLEDKALPAESKRSIYNKVKAGMFRNKRAFLLYLKDNGFVAKDYEPKKIERKAPAPKKEGKPKGKKKAAAKEAAAKEGEKA